MTWLISRISDFGTNVGMMEKLNTDGVAQESWFFIILHDVHVKLVGGLEHFFYFPIYWVANHPKWLSYFSEGLKPPTRKWCCCPPKQWTGGLRRCLSRAGHDQWLDFENFGHWKIPSWLPVQSPQMNSNDTHYIYIIYYIHIYIYIIHVYSYVYIYIYDIWLPVQIHFHWLSPVESPFLPLSSHESLLSSRGKKVVDVVGWAPTADTLALAENKCTKQRFQGYTMVQPMVNTGPGPGVFVWTMGAEPQKMTSKNDFPKSEHSFWLAMWKHTCNTQYTHHYAYIYIYLYVYSDILSGIYSDILSDILSGIYSDTHSGILSRIYSDILSDILSGIYSDTHSGILSRIYSDILSDILSGIYSDTHSGILSRIYSDILSDILSGIYSDTHSGILSRIYSDILSDILSGIYSDTHSGILSRIYSDILFPHSSWHSFLHSFWHLFWHSIWHSILPFCLAWVRVWACPAASRAREKCSDHLGPQSRRAGRGRNQRGGEGRSCTFVKI